MPRAAHIRLAQACGFSLHAGIAIGGAELEKLERLCRYISRPTLAPERLAQTAGGAIRYTLKTPYRDGTTHVLFEPSTSWHALPPSCLCRACT